MDEKKTKIREISAKIRGFEDKTIRECMEERAHEELDAQFPGKEGRQRPRNPIKKAILLKWREEDGSDHGTI